MTLTSKNRHHTISIRRPLDKNRIIEVILMVDEQKHIKGYIIKVIKDNS